MKIQCITVMVEFSCCCFFLYRGDSWCEQVQTHRRTAGGCVVYRQQACEGGADRTAEKNTTES